MERLSIIIKIFLVISLTFGVTAGVFADVVSGNTNATQTIQVGTDAQGKPINYTAQVNGQTNSYAGGVTQSQAGGGSAVTSSVASGVAGCASSVISGYATKLVGSLLSSTNTDKYKWVSVTSYGVDTQSGGSNGPSSFDSVAYCIINAMIQYMTDATIQWINSGFDGNPAFVQNPQEFFSSLADQTTAGFIQDVVGGATGLNICQPFRINIATGLGAGSGYGYGNDYGGRAQCTLGDITNSIQDFNVYTSGGGSPGGANYSGSLNNWLALNQDQNNPIGSYFLAQQELQRRVALQQNTATLDLTQGNGFLSFKKCDTTPDDPGGNNGTVIKGKTNCKTTTPGHVIEDQLNNTLHAGTDRLVLADKFDQVVTTLVNTLIKTALDKVLTPSN